MDYLTTLLGTNISPDMFEDDVPFPQGGICWFPRGYLTFRINHQTDTLFEQQGATCVDIVKHFCIYCNQDLQPGHQRFGFQDIVNGNLVLPNDSLQLSF